jgi:dTDP-4-amino-4,6-dideoxygalactose transaminase
MPVPLLDVNAQNHPLEKEFTEAFLRVFRSGQFIMGAEVTQLEAAIADLTETKHAIGVSSGTDAILLALMALGIKAGDEVLVPTFTFFATAGCVNRVGATPVFVDACPICFNIDLNDAKRKVTSRTKAIIPVHLFGQSADMDAVMDLANEHGLKVVEDGAQSIGAAYKGHPCGSIGDFGTYSFFPSKNLGGFGDGGALVTNDDDLAEHARILRVHGSKPKYYHHFVGGNFRLDPLQAAMLAVKLPHYDRYTANRQANAAYYLSALSQLPGVVQADPSHCKCVTSQDAALAAAHAKIVLPVAYPHNTHIWNQFTLRVLGSGQRDALRDHLSQAKIGCEIYYPVTMDQQKCFADTPASSRTGCDVAHRLASEVISIPIYPELSPEQRTEVVAAIAAFLTA